jgi:hypothetical protein
MTPEETKQIEKAKAMIMPHGKYQGDKLGSIPSAYLFWVAEEWSDPKISEAADRVWRFRDSIMCHKGPAKWDFNRR